MMGVSERPKSPDGKTILPLHAHGVTLMSIGLMLKEGEAVIWRGPMLQGALQQLMGQVAWGELDALIVDLPPGTGDVQLTLSQKYAITGAIVVSTPQDVALLDARKAHRHVRQDPRARARPHREHVRPTSAPTAATRRTSSATAAPAPRPSGWASPSSARSPSTSRIRLAGDSGTPVAAAAPRLPPRPAPSAAIARRLVDRRHWSETSRR